MGRAYADEWLGRISYHVGVDLRPRKLAGLVWGVDAPIDFTQPPLANRDKARAQDRRYRERKRQTATSGSEGEPEIASIGRG